MSGPGSGVLDNSGVASFTYATVAGATPVTTVYVTFPDTFAGGTLTATVATFDNLISIADGILLGGPTDYTATDIFTTEQSNTSGGETLTITSAPASPDSLTVPSGVTLLSEVGTSDVSYVASDFAAVNTSAGPLATFEVTTTTVSGDQVSYDTKFYETNGTTATLLFDAPNNNGSSPLPAPLVASGPISAVNIGADTSAGGIIVFDPGTGSNAVTVQLTASNGTLSTVVDGVEMGGSGQLTLTGDLATVNAELGALTFTGTALGAGTITAVAAYNGVSSAAAAIATTVDDTAPYFDMQTASQTWTAGQAISLQLPAGAFVDPAGAALTYTAGTWVDGVLEALPSWLSINPTTGTLSGTVPADITSSTIELWIDATNTSGETSALDVFPTTLVGVPTLSITGPSGPTDSRLQTVSGQIDTAHDGLVVSIYDGSDLIGQVTPNASGIWTTSVLLNSTGAQTLTAEVTDNGVVYSSPGVSVTLTVPAARDDYYGDGQSQLLIENSSGAVVVGAAASGTAAYAEVSSLGPEWSFHGNGDFLGDGQSQFLIQNTAGQVDIGEVVNGAVVYTQVFSDLDPEWSFVGTGDFLGLGRDQFLIEDTAGAVYAASLQNDSLTTTEVAALGSEWSFKETGDFLGDGKSDFLIENTAGAVVVGEVTGGTTAYTTVAYLGSEWKFVGAGDFLGDGKDDFLIENTSGAVVIGEVVNGAASYTTVTSLGPEWTFVGAGDYLGEGHDQFLIENTSGAVVVGDYTGGAVHFTQVASLGPEWAFH